MCSCSTSYLTYYSSYSTPRTVLVLCSTKNRSVSTSYVQESVSILVYNNQPVRWLDFLIIINYCRKMDIHNTIVKGMRRRRGVITCRDRRLIYLGVGEAICMGNDLYNKERRLRLMELVTADKTDLSLLTRRKITPPSPSQQG
jgi:hypothetical protein